MKNLLISITIISSIIIFPQEQTITTSDSVDLFVNVKGEGIPCLYVHGGPGSGSYWLEVFYGNYLEKYFKMIYLDQRGVSRSGSPADGNYSMERMVKDFEEVRIALGIKEWLTLGHSFGGILQMGYVQKHPEVIKGMIMVNCTLNLEESLDESWAPKGCEILELKDCSPYLNKKVPLGERLNKLVNLLKEKDLFWKMAYADKENEKIMDKTFGDIPNWNSGFGNAAMNIGEYFKDFTKVTDSVQTPVLFFYGTQDWMVGPEHYKKINFPNMLLWKSNVGHMPFMENKEDLERAINSFLIKYSFTN